MLTTEGIKWMNEASKDMKKRITKYNQLSETKGGRGKKKKTTHKKKRLPKHYTARLSTKDRQKQIKSIRRSSKAYQKGKYIQRPKLKSYKHKKSSWVTKFETKYGKDVKTYKEIEKATGIPAKALRKVVKKGKGAYYSSGSRPNQTATSWGKARMYSYIMGGPTRRVDQHITDKYNVKLP
tara:strand:- start:518 stop:1057 length:540 start_codon:yes stop_codon:yes gene_type:complete